MPPITYLYDMITDFFFQGRWFSEHVRQNEGLMCRLEPIRASVSKGGGTAWRHVLFTSDMYIYVLLISYMYMYMYVCMWCVYMYMYGCMHMSVCENVIIIIFRMYLYESISLPLFSLLFSQFRLDIVTSVSSPLP